MGSSKSVREKHVKKMRPRKEILYKSCDGSLTSPKGSLAELEKKRTTMLLDLSKLKGASQRVALQEDIDIVLKEIEVCKRFLRREADRSKKNRLKVQSPMSSLDCLLKKLKYPDYEVVINKCKRIQECHPSRFYYRSRLVEIVRRFCFDLTNLT